MSNLSRKEIVELLKNTLRRDLEDRRGIKQAIQSCDDDIQAEIYNTNINNILKALEQAGVLMLVDDEPKVGDVVKYHSDTLGVLDASVIPLWKKRVKQIIQRNSTPVYTTRKED